MRGSPVREIMTVPANLSTSYRAAAYQFADGRMQLESRIASIERADSGMMPPMK
jgi:hypothetical protein